MASSFANQIWVEKYRPQHVKDLVMPDAFKKYFTDMIASGSANNLLLSSPAPGTGKCLDFSELIRVKVSEKFYEQHKELFED